MKSFLKILKTIFLMIMVTIVSGCQKDSSPTQDDNSNQQISVECQVDNRLYLDEMTIVSMLDGHSVTSSSNISMLKNRKPQVVVIFDADDNIRAMYRGIVSEGEKIIVDAHSTALAMVTCNPIVALVGDSCFSQITTVIEALPGFPNLLSNIESLITSGNNIFDTTNTSVKQSVETVINEFLGDIEDTSNYQPSTGSKGYVDHLPFVNHAPLLFELPGDSPDYGVGGNFALRNLALCPTYFGTLITEGGRVQEVIVKTRESYTALGATSDFLLSNSLVYGERCYLMMDYNSDNTIHVTNLNDDRAVMDIGNNFAQDIMRIIPFTLSGKAWANLATTLGSMAVNAVVGARSDNRPIWEASKGIAKALWDCGLQMIEKDIVNGALGSVNTEWCKKILNAIGGKIFIYYSATIGTSNIGLRIYYMLKYPNDLEFCFKHKWDADNQCDIYMQCGPEPEPEPEPEPDNGDWVDLGLPSGILWATRNVGANAPEDFGDYFAWGETEPKNIYNMETYRYINGYDTIMDGILGNYKFTKYCNKSSFGYNGFRDNITVLQPGDDAATANWGNGARTPTKEEWEELFNHISPCWTSRNGVEGIIFVGFNGNTLFLPVAGGIWDSTLCTESQYSYSPCGDYMSSSLCTTNPSCTWVLEFDIYHLREMVLYLRGNGFPVRAVRSTN